ncbi:hypothetical protein JDV02_004640 [Purpureocillium takamizusanense]|uniref:Zeta toxin domain-containing protein n=1 Tax=Purpureocillium takamizusanense TaxID=2060973 RepID=A0A9Q8QGS5_9HYPO|nr:uncharacterized protein JDV02_004640 [Purpureocillium takamizusanense]UNI18367.1 hypothetical protein JDV02_004640 [Purpureocillium takamizusanense]
MEVQVILISGRAGSGKTTTGNEMAEQLRLRGLCHAHIDCDNLDNIHPEEPGAEMLLANLRAMWSNYFHRRGITRLILSGTAVALEFESIRQAVKSASETLPDGAIGGQTGQAEMKEVKVEARVVLLTAPDEVASQRLARREVGSEITRMLKSSKKMARVLEEAVGNWAMTVDTKGKDVTETALHILRARGWVA